MDTPPKSESTSVEHAATHRLEYTDAEARKVLRKLDWHILPFCFLLYTFSVLDRGNLGNAKLAGLDTDLGLTSDQYTWLGTIFYIAYIVFQFTSMGWKIFKPHQWVTFVVFFWGTVSTLQAVCTNWKGLMACRFLLGVAETMFGPGIPLYFSFFYPRRHMGLRFGLFLSGAALANAYSGALAYGISHIHSSVSNWKIIFIIEGAPTALLALITWFFLPDSPREAKFLTPREREIALHLADDHQAQTEDPGQTGIHFKNLFDAFKDYRNWLFGLSNFSTNVSFASLPLFLPTIISEFGTYSTLTSNGLSAPPYLLSFFLIIGVSFFSDRFRVRGPFAAFFASLSAIGYLILALTDAVSARYVSCFLIVTIFVTVSIVLVWNANTNENESKRTGGVWIIQTVGQCGTVLGTHSFPSNQKPYYRRGMWTGFGFSLFSALICTTLSFVLWQENKRRDQLYGQVDRTTEMGHDEDNGDLPAEAKFRYII
ncbi:hypothetical protein LTR10_022816 [Elasticomyces elasticus]|uniref:Major facilitator superfamily (MFS) profile domain-containing protein n=1 Tax=Exophiala sideris TaxID=1016849 RepID=A0ABR0JIZ1_9EURO|nr:hypothetical protein LTR10_022816 [Elasticomyces elasticus]KAK5033582.1 hypothetical protein LTS07_003887 [Exophiala sideris]KAK5041923.1 hypothetical protein LTR13_001728 [Exophiala sideris]KAK5064126.1 hypothetical protein LTR69_003895 [Exophiala sideris]KAK5185191.1 hypothetical protein LTR44_002179 [Eurotiomycetes sp. CCFEE 6388]